MSSQDVDDAVAEASLLCDHVAQHHANANQLKNEVRQEIEDEEDQFDALRLRNHELKSKADRLLRWNRKLEEKAAILKDDAGEIDMTAWRRVADSFNQARFDSNLYQLIAADESLDRLRKMSPEHKSAILDLERQITVDKLNKAEDSLRLVEAKAACIQDDLNSKNDSISALNQKNAALETRVAGLEASAKNLRQRIHTTTTRYDAAQKEIETMLGRAKEMKAEIAKKADEVVVQTSEVTRLAAVNDNLSNDLGGKNIKILGLERELLDKDAKISELERELSDKDVKISKLDNDLNWERRGHENTERQRQEIESVLRQSRRETDTVYRLIAEGLAEIHRLEDEARELSGSLDIAKSASAERGLKIQAKDAELARHRRESDQKDTDLARINTDLTRERAQLEQKDTELRQVREQVRLKEANIAQSDMELDRMKEELAQNDTELRRTKGELFQKTIDVSRCQTALEKNEADLTQRNKNLALSLMGQRYKAQDTDYWLPLVNSIQSSTSSTTKPAVEDRWWTVAPSWKQIPSTLQPSSLFESIVLLYGEVLNFDNDGCVALQTIIRCLEVAEVAPIAMVVELLRRLLTENQNMNKDPSQGTNQGTNQNNDAAETYFGLLFSAWQIISLIRLRWPEMEGLTDLEQQCQQKLNDSTLDCQLIYRLVAGIGCGSRLISAFTNQDTIPLELLAFSHKYCPEQKVLLLALARSSVWALDLCHHTIRLVDKSKGSFDKYGTCYQLHGHGENIMVPSSTNEDLDFIFDHLD